MARTDSGRDASGMQPQVVSGVQRLVGLGREMETLRDALEGRRVLVLIEGEAWIGKTRLVRELLRGGTVEGDIWSGGATFNLAEFGPGDPDPQTPLIAHLTCRRLPWSRDRRPKCSTTHVMAGSLSHPATIVWEMGAVMTSSG